MAALNAFSERGAFSNWKPANPYTDIDSAALAELGRREREIEDMRRAEARSRDREQRERELEERDTGLAIQALESFANMDNEGFIGPREDIDPMPLDL